MNPFPSPPPPPASSLQRPVGVTSAGGTSSVLAPSSGYDGEAPCPSRRPSSTLGGAPSVDRETAPASSQHPRPSQVRPRGDGAPADPKTVAGRLLRGGAQIPPRTEVRAGGQVVAWAATQVQPGISEATVNIQVECAAGHQPAWARRLLVHDVLTRAEYAGCRRVVLVLPLGDTEILDALRQHCHPATTRAAGASCIVEGEFRTPFSPVHLG